MSLGNQFMTDEGEHFFFWSASETSIAHLQREKIDAEEFDKGAKI